MNKHDATRRLLATAATLTRLLGASVGLLSIGAPAVVPPVLFSLPGRARARKRQQQRRGDRSLESHEAERGPEYYIQREEKMDLSGG